MEFAIYLAVALIVFVGFLHSYLGERYILVRLFQRGSVPKLFGTTEFTMRTLRFAWHLTTIAWLGFALILLQITNSAVDNKSIGMIIGCIFLLHFAVALIASKGRHLSWPIFLAIGSLVIYSITA